ncbi:MAG TPA: CHAT domain-containing protein, partial [Lacipirellulaceae bacterium]
SAGTRIVEYFCTESRGGCWIINPNRPDRPDWIDLPGLSKVTATSVAEEVVTALTAWKAARSRSMRERQSFGSAVHDSFARSKAAIEVAVQFVRKTALGPLLRQLTAEGATHLVVIPHQALHMLPFHAALEQDQPVVTYAPSLTVLSRLRRPSRTALKRSVVVADSVPECPAEQCQYRGQCWRLPAARLEGRYVQNMLQTTGLVVNAAEGATATVEWFEQSLSEAGFLHLATHAVFNAEDPGSSGILFGTGPPVIGTDLDDLPYIAHDGRLAVPGVPACSQLWTLRRLWKRVDLSSCQLAFLGGCETSVVHWDDALEEFLGIAGGFLQAGVPTVIGSLWEISDLATLIKTRRFYRNLLAGKNGPADALFEAQSWLRMVTTEELLNKEADLILDCYALEFVESPQSMEHALAALLGHLPAANSTPFGHPFFWAPFRCVGLP